MIPAPGMRINRFIARCGKASRRDADKFILAGRVTINGEPCREFGVTIVPGVDVVTLDGERLELPSLLYYKCYKPGGVVSTLDDPQGRESIAGILRSGDIQSGVVPAGRLDLGSEGLLILTNDGDMLQKLTHPSHKVEKIYRVLTHRWPMESELAKLRRGVKCREYFAKALRVTRMGPQPKDREHPETGYWLEIVMGEGRKREIREMLKVIRASVLRLVRIQHGPIQVGTLKPGEIRELEEWERKSLSILFDN